jgi:hypothetical protein
MSSQVVGGLVMRDIRADLRERLKLAEERARAANAYCEKMVRQLQTDRDAKIADLKVTIAMVSKLIKFEEEQIGKAAPQATKPATKATPSLSLAKAG